MYKYFLTQSNYNYILIVKKCQYKYINKILPENCNIKCHQRFGERFSESDASKGESQASFFLG